jgi:hypothetical protein
VTDTRQSLLLRPDAGFSLVETMVSVTVLMVVAGTVMSGVLGMSNVSTMVTNRTDMHNGVRNATELLTQEVGQAGRISLPAAVTLTGAAGIGATALTVSSSAGMFAGEILVLDTGAQQESVQLAAEPGGGTTLTLLDPLESAHAAGAPVSVLGGFANGVVPSAAGGFADGSTGTVLKIFGDIHDDGNMVYVEYRCSLAEGRLYRTSVPFTAVAKPVPGVEEVLIDNIETNPQNLDGTTTPCFTYQEDTFDGNTYVIGVAITLTVRTRTRDRNTGDFLRETKALLNVSPRNVFNVWQMASLSYYDRIQPMPASVLALLPG